MAVFNPRERTLECKIVYYGPGRGGKTTNLEQIFRTGKKYVTSDMVSVKTKGDRTLCFDFLPIGMGKVKGCDVKVQLYTVPGQAKYKSTRKLVLKNVDGVVFVADSLTARRKANKLALRDLQQNLAEIDLSIFRIPLVLQYNKRDLGARRIPIMSIEMMAKELNGQLHAPAFEASAVTGAGVPATFKKCLSLTLNDLLKQL